MKRLFTIPMFLLLFSCNSKSNINPTQRETIAKERSDINVGVHIIPAEISGTDYIEKEYFNVVKGDTSSSSCIITENKLNGKMSIHYRFYPYERIPLSFSSEDTIAVVEHEPVKKFNQKSTYKDQIRELNLILKYASKDNDLSKLKSLRLAMLSIKGLSESVTKQHISQYGEKFTHSSNQKAAALIENSRLKTDLNNILSPYSVIVHKTSIDGLMYYVPQDSKVGTKPVLDEMVIFKLIPID